MLKLGSEIINNRFTASATFGNNSWAIIKQVAQAGAIPASWAVGDEKEFIGNDGNTYHVVIYDKQVGRYAYSDGSGRRSNIVLGFKELSFGSEWNTTGTNAGGLANSQMRKNLNGLTGVQEGRNFMTQVIPDDLRPLLEEVNIVTNTGGTTFTDTSTSANKLFPPCYINVMTTTTSHYVAEGTLWDYYATHTSSSNRIKYRVGTTTAGEYWLASPYVGSTSEVNYVGTSGNMSHTVPYKAYYVAPCFAF